MTNPHYIGLPPLRPATTVAEFLAREEVVTRLRAMRERVELDLNTIRYWNLQHPDQPIDPSFEEAMLAYLDGRGPMPSLPPASEAHA